MNTNEKILEVSHLKKYFKAGKGVLKAVDDVSFFIRKGETMGVVGESGCGKTTCGRTCIGIYDRTEGEVLYKGKDVHSLKGQDKKDFTKEVQIIFQDQIPLIQARQDLMAPALVTRVDLGHVAAGQALQFPVRIVQFTQIIDDLRCCGA